VVSAATLEAGALRVVEGLDVDVETTGAGGLEEHDARATENTTAPPNTRSVAMILFLLTIFDHPFRPTDSIRRVTFTLRSPALMFVNRAFTP